MDGKLLFEVRKGIKAVAGIETLLVLTVAALYFAIVPWGVGPDKLMADAELLRGRLEQGGQIPFAVGKAVGELEAIISHTPPGCPGVHTTSPAFSGNQRRNR